MLRWIGRVPALAEEGLQQIHAARRQDAGVDFHLVIQLRVIEYLQHRMYRASLGIVSAID